VKVKINLIILYPVPISLKNTCEITTFLDKIKLREFVASKQNSTQRNAKGSFLEWKENILD
jgi:hypothetical protein